MVLVIPMVIVARKLGLPYPVLLVVGGLAVSFVPGLPTLALEPDLVFLIFLPPLLFAAAWPISWRDFTANLRPISLLALGLVLFTTTIVAVVVYVVIPNFNWGIAFVLGAIVSPTDPVTATAVASRLGIPRRIVTVLESESMMNDATGLVLYRVAVGAVVTGTFSAWNSIFQFVFISVGGVVIGLAVAWLVNELVSRLDDSPIENTILIMTSYAAYLIADSLTVSGILSVVTAGLYLGRRSSGLFLSETRVQANGIWQTLSFLLNGLVFILIGLQLRVILQSFAADSLPTLIWYGLLTSLTVMLVRIIWVFPGTYLPRWLSRRLREREPNPPWQYPTILAWSGMRGVLSLAAALALPLQLENGLEFPQRNLLIFLTFCVILTTLLLQGLSLPIIIRRIKVPGDGAAIDEKAQAHLEAALAGKSRLEELAQEEWLAPQKELVSDLLLHYENKRQRFEAHTRGQVDEVAEERALVYARLERELLEAERLAVVQLRDTGAINDEVLSEVQRDLDFRNLVLEIE